MSAPDARAGARPPEAASETDRHVPHHAQEPRRPQAAAPHHQPRRPARRRLHGGHARAHRHHRQDLRRPLRRRQRRHRRLRPRRRRVRPASGSATSGPASTPRSSTPIDAVAGRRRGRGQHRGLRPARRPRRQADRQPRHGRADASVAIWIADDDAQPVRPRRRPGPAGRRRGRDRQGQRRRRPASAVGDTVHGAHPGRHRSTSTIVGIATFGGADSPGGASFALFTPDAAQRLPRPSPARSTRSRSSAADGRQRRASSSTASPRSCPTGTEVLTGARDHRRGPAGRSRRA